MMEYRLYCEADSKPNHDEDAYFVCPKEKVMGVADGVGGFNSCRINPKLYAEKLMREAERASRTGVQDPLKILEMAYQHTIKPGFFGGSTACIVSLSSSGYLEAINIGDSGFLVVRNGQTALKSKPGQRFENAPFFLGRRPDDGLEVERPSDGQVYKIKSRKDDLIILGTDGLFDNLNESEVLRFVKGRRRQGLASALVQHAFSEGWKTDDITVIVGKVEKI